MSQNRTNIVLVAACALIDADGRVLLAQRPEGKSMAGLWEFPGGKVEPGEDPRQALRRELREELSIEIDVGDFLGRGISSGVCLDVYLARIRTGTIAPREHAATGWFTAGQLAQLEWADADVPVLEPLRRVLASIPGLVTTRSRR